MNNLLGNYAVFVNDMAAACSYPLSYLSKEWDDIAMWRSIAQGKVFELLSFNPPRSALNARCIEQFEYDGLSVELVSYSTGYGPETQAYVLKPLDAGGKLPAVAAFHDHGGFKYFGKEKITELPPSRFSPDENAVLNERRQGYGGLGWANRLAKRGYVVLAPDIFLWGSRKMQAEECPSEYSAALAGKEPGSRAYIDAYNEFTREYENLTAKSLFMAGSSWPGVMLCDTTRAIDYLLTRPDVDGARIGCGGHSGGGEMSAFLAGLDSRVNCAVITCFMATFAEVVRSNIQSHTWMFHLPHLARYMDLPDIPSLSGPKPLMVQYGSNDPLFSAEGKQRADNTLRALYTKMKQPENYEGRFYQGGHKFDTAMQDEAFDWFDRHLKT
jgi:dienelactone hydrolase